ncbi:unnamed protein product, partial [Ectocarpus sp. 12 AP-2014]
VHAFSPLVVQGITNVADAADPDAYWRKVQKWTKGLDLFSKKIVLFPINSALHWSLLVLINPDLFEKRVNQKEQEKEKEKGKEKGNDEDKDAAAAAAARKKTAAPTAAAAAAAAAAESTNSAKKKAGKKNRAETGANAGGESGDGGGGGGGGGGGSSSSSSSQSSTVSHTEGSRFQEENDEDDDEEMPQAASPSRHAASLAVAASAGAAMPSSPPPCESEYLSQASPLPSRGKAMEWPPSTEIQRHSISLLDDGSGRSDAGPTGDAGGGGGGGGACTRSGTGRSPHGVASQPGEENAVAVGEGGGSVTTAGESDDRLNVESLPMEMGMEMEVEEEDQLPSRAGEIVGGGRTRLSSSSSPASPSATVSRGCAPPMPGSASGSPAAPGSATSTPVEALDVEVSNGSLHDGPESVLSPPPPPPLGRETKGSTAIAADSRREGRWNQPSPSSLMSPSSPPCAGAPGERSGAAAAAGAAGGSQPSPGSTDAGDRPGREDAHRRRRRRRSPDPTAGGMDTTIAGRTTVRRRSVGVGARRQEMPTVAQAEGIGGPIDVDALTSNDEPGPASGEPEPAVDVEALSDAATIAHAEIPEVEALGSNAAAVVAETELRTRAGSTRSRRSLSRSTNGSGCKATQLPLPHEHSPPDSSSGDGKRPTTSGGVALGQEEPGGGGKVADAGAVGLSSSPPDGDLDGGEGAAGAEEIVDDSPIPCMLLLDSTKGHRSQEVFRMVRKYVEAAWNNTHGKSSGRKSKVDVTAKLLGGCSPPIPQQTNDCDCGVYVIHYAKLILEKPPLTTQR